MDDGKIDFSRIKITNYKTNGRMNPPRIREEYLVIERWKDNYIETATKHIEKQSKGSANISKSAYKGIK